MILTAGTLVRSQAVEDSEDASGMHAGVCRPGHVESANICAKAQLLTPAASSLHQPCIYTTTAEVLSCNAAHPASILTV